MSLSKRLKTYLLSSKIRRADIVLLVIVALSVAFWFRVNIPFSELFKTSTDIELGYSAKQGDDGLLYVLDEGHERIICFDLDGVIRYTIENPTDEEGNLLYIDDFAISDEYLYITASVWDEMSLASEELVSYDNNGKFVETITKYDYEYGYANKHTFFGLTYDAQLYDGEGGVNYIEVVDDDLVEEGEEYFEPEYDNELDATYDATIIGNDYYILSKYGDIELFNDNIEGEIIYDTLFDGDESIVPYRLAHDNEGNIYFTDIRNRAVRRLDKASRTSTIVYENTSSLTVNITNNGGLMLIDDEGLHIYEDGSEKTYLSLKKNTKTIALQILLIIFGMVWGICVAMLAIRLIYSLAKRTYTSTQLISFWVLSSVIIVTSLVCGILINAFSQSYREKIEEQVESAAYMVANEISGSDIENVEKDGGFGGEAYNNLCRTMEKAFSSDIEFYKKLYCNILKFSEDWTDGYAVAYLDQSIGSYYPLDEVETDELRTVYDTGKTVWNQEVEDVSGTYLSVKVPVYNDEGRVCGAVAVGVETYIITDTIRAMFVKILMSVVVLMMLVWLVSVEMMSFANNYDVYKRNLANKENDVLPGHLIRLLVFLVFAAYNMSATFLPVYLLRKSEIFPERIREYMGALPITVNIFIIGLMSLFCANLLKKFGIRKIMTITVMCSFAGNLLIYITSGFYGIFIGLILDGIGVGLITNTVYVMLTYIKDEINRIWGLTVYNGAYLSGVNFGMIFGSFLAVMVSQRFVFLIVALTWLLMLCLTGFMMASIEKLIEVPIESDISNSENANLSTAKFVWNKTIMGFIVLIQNPYIVFGSFVFYFVPIFCDKSGYSETVCSLLIMLYSEVAVLGTDNLTKLFSKLFGTYSMYMALLMNIAALIIYALTQNMTGMIIALIIMGIGAAYGKPVQQNYFLELKEVIQYGEDKSIGIYNFSENIGESLGPVVFGRLMEAARLKIAAIAFGSVIAGMGLIHYIIGRGGHKHDK